MNRKPIFAGVAIVVLAGSAWLGWNWYEHGRWVVKTDNAYVRGDITMIAAKTEGYVSSIAVGDNATVQAGDLLLQLDPRDSEVTIDSAQADLAGAMAGAARARAEAQRVQSDAQRMAAEASAANSGAQQAAALARQANAEARSRALSVTVASAQVVAQSDAVIQAQAGLRAAEAASAVASADRGRYAALASRGYVSQARMDQVDAQARATDAKVAEARAAVLVARQQVAVLSASRAKSSSDAGSAGAGADSAQSGAQGAVARARASAAAAKSGQTAIGSAYASISAADAAVQAAQARLNGARIGQGYGSVTAPVSGQVANRTVQVGQLVRPGAILMAIVPLDQVFVVANFKETQIGGLARGQPVSLKIDAFPDEKVTGTIESLAPASGSQFSLLPTDTATGNFTKIVQRVPVRIAIDPQFRSRGFLRPGLSVTVSVDTAAKASASVLTHK
jgi:membrane fusion protein (multidrug efflux system)